MTRDEVGPGANSSNFLELNIGELLQRVCITLLLIILLIEIYLFFSLPAGFEVSYILRES